MGDFKRTAAESGVARGGGAAVEIICFHPGIDQSQRIAET